MKPLIFKIEPEEEAGQHFLYCLEDAYSRKIPDSRKDNPLVIELEEAELLKRNLDASIVPYVAINENIPEEEVRQVKNVLGKVLEGYISSENKKTVKIDLIEIKNPENDEEFQNFLLHELVEAGGNPYYTEEQRKTLPEYVSWFCVNSEVVKTLAGQIVMDQKKIKSLNNTIGYDD